jgi:hypothetical protein
LSTELHHRIYDFLICSDTLRVKPAGRQRFRSSHDLTLLGTTKSIRDGFQGRLNEAFYRTAPVVEVDVVDFNFNKLIRLFRKFSTVGADMHTFHGTTRSLLIKLSMTTELIHYTNLSKWLEFMKNHTTGETGMEIQYEIAGMSMDEERQMQLINTLYSMADPYGLRNPASSQPLGIEELDRMVLAVRPWWEAEQAAQGFPVPAVA